MCFGDGEFGMELEPECRFCHALSLTDDVVHAVYKQGLLMYKLVAL